MSEKFRNAWADVVDETEYHAPYGVSYTCIKCDSSVIPGDPHFEEEVCEFCHKELIK